MKEKKIDYTGFNRILKSEFVQNLRNRARAGTIREFLDDWKWIFSYSRKYGRAIVFYMVVGMLGSGLSIGSSVVSKYLIDIIVGKKLNQLWILILLMGFTTVFSIVFSSLVSRFSAKISIYVHNDIQADIFKRIISADWLSLNGYANGDLLNRFSNDVSTISSNSVNWIPSVVLSVFNFAATFCVLAYYDMTMALISLASAPILLLISRYIMRRMREHRRKILDMNSKLMSFEAETFYNMDTIKSFGIADRYSRELEKWQSKYRDHNLEYNLFQIKSNAATKLLSALVGFVAFGYCLFRLWSDDISYGTMTLFIQQHGALAAQFSTLVGLLPNMLHSSVSAHRIRELVQLPAEHRDPEASDQMRAKAGDGLTVRMRNVEFSYDSQQGVISRGDFIARPGEIVALVGPSGEGKTTLLRLILGLITPENGNVTLTAADGSEIDMNADARQFFSYVPQGNTILFGSVAENLRMVKEDATDEQIIEALQVACIWDHVKKLPKTIHSPIGERGKGLSEGQAQRIAIARAVLRDAPVILLDEATSALDVATERQVLRNIVKQHPNKTCIVTTHRPSVLGLCQRVYRVMETRVTEVSEEESSRLVQDF